MPPDDNTAALVAALEAAGHGETAGHVRDRALADQLRDRHPDLAAALVGRTGPDAPAPPQAEGQLSAADEELWQTIQEKQETGKTNIDADEWFPGFGGDR